MVRRAWLRLECLLRAWAEVRRLWDPVRGGTDCTTPHIPAPIPGHPLPTIPCQTRACLDSAAERRAAPLGCHQCHQPGAEPPIPDLARPEHVPALCLWLSTLQEQADDGLQALEFHTELVLHVEAAGFAPAQGQGARWPRAQQVPHLGIWQREGTGSGAQGLAGLEWAAGQALTCSL